MPDQFADALERMDVNFENVGPDAGIFDLLRTVLRMPPSEVQMQIATEKLLAERAAFLIEGLTVGYFTRRGRTSAVLRDVRGRFLAFGTANIQTFLDNL